ncbi:MULTISPECIES: hypothetical protein [Priestia]|jgi:hypothetical protein|uniref:hypothetical protein n=1 Tax=Priestia TaxID=2800373 RepID=UPI001EF047DF|nr:MULTISPECIES: hypothetical protein [Priestia]MCG0047685.1 hypothetical protein [Priestia aryabhattai]MDF2055331.1 hypothetical protein [Priestia megaterium]MDF2059293.1 hypothetical protein [Priestia megaterium]MED4065294.1 hypothetical protein [Priestia megaterium]
MQHKVNIDKEYNFIEALRDDHYASFDSRGRGLRMANDLFCCMQGGKIHASKLQRIYRNKREYEKGENAPADVKRSWNPHVYGGFDKVVDRTIFCQQGPSNLL